MLRVAIQRVPLGVRLALLGIVFFFGGCSCGDLHGSYGVTSPKESG
jgi:hypothetical protein